MQLAQAVYQIMAAMPEEERFGLTSQIKRSVVSIPSNIAEGAGRSSNKDFIRFLYMSMGSANELETQLLLATKLGFYKAADLSHIERLLTEVQKMCNKLMQSLQ